MFISNLNTTLEASRTIKVVANIQYICTMVRGEHLHQFDTLSAEVGSASPENLMSIILVFGTYFPPVNALSE